MRMLVFCILAIWLILVAPVCVWAAPPYRLVEPVFDENGSVFIEKDGRRYPVLQPIPASDSQVADISSILVQGMSETSLRLGDFTKNFMVVRINNRYQDSRPAEIFTEPLYICLMKGGNRPKQGFYLQTDGQTIPKTQCYYIEMPPVPFLFECIFAHENGHLIDAYLMDVVFGYHPQRPVHTTPAVTDFRTAFSEGWGNHFETMTVNATVSHDVKKSYTLDDRKGQYYFTHLQDVWSLSNHFKRYSWIKQNLFAFKRQSRLRDGLTGEEKVKNFYYNWMNYSFLGGELKNIQQMLSCEGVCATIFYRMATDEDLQNRYRDKAFYRPFTGEVENRDIRKVISPQENIYLKMNFAKYQQFQEYRQTSQVTSGPLMLDFILKYVELFPEDADDVLLLFAESTYLTSVWPDALRFYRDADAVAHLTMYDRNLLTASIKAMMTRLKSTMAEIKVKPYLIARGVGPALWIENDRFIITMMGHEFHLSINLNAAEDFELMTLPGVTHKQVQKLIEYRDGRGYFRTLLDVKRADALTAGQYAELVRMRGEFKKACANNNH